MSTTGRKTIWDRVDDLVDEEGLKTDVKHTITPKSLLGMLGIGITIATFSVLLGRILPNRKLEKQTKLLEQIKEGLKA